MSRGVFAILWAIVGTTAAVIFVFQAKSIGGVQYIVHVGLGWPALIEIFAAIMSFVVSFGAICKQRFAYELARILSWTLLLPFGAILLFGILAGDKIIIPAGLAGIVFIYLNLTRALEKNV